MAKKTKYGSCGSLEDLEEMIKSFYYSNKTHEFKNDGTIWREGVKLGVNWWFTRGRYCFGKVEQ